MAFTWVRNRSSSHTCSQRSTHRRYKDGNRSLSGSSWISYEFDALPNDENATTKRRSEKIFTCDKLLTSEEVREGLVLAARQNSPQPSAICDEPVQGEFRGHRHRGVLGATVAASRDTEDPTNAVARASKSSVEPFCSVSSSRRTSIFIGDPEIITQLSAKLAAKALEADNEHGQAEAKYCNFEDQEGSVRKSSLMRSISRDDYLLARGANPRTGIVTPGVHSTCGSNEREELLEERGLGPAAKWRQRGDQWISFDLDQQTPLSSSACPPKSHQPSRTLRTPQGLTASTENHTAVRSIPQYKKVSCTGPCMAKSSPDAGTLPGTFPISPHKEDTDPWTVLKPSSSSGIKRKPVGSPPSKELVSIKFQNQNFTDASAETIVTKPPFAEEARSSSAPAIRTAEFSSPADVCRDSSKQLPNTPRLPEAEKNSKDDDMAQIHFLGHRWPEQAGDAQGPKILANSGPDKELPCLPMNSGLSRSSHLLQKMKQRTTESATAGSKPHPPSDAWEVIPKYPYIQNPKIPLPARRHHRIQEVQSERKTQSWPIPVPIYDNPPPQVSSLPRSMGGKVTGPRVMPQVRIQSQMTGSESDIFTISPPIMSTNIRIPTHMSTQQPRRPQIPLQIMKGHVPGQQFEENFQASCHQDASYTPRPRNGNISTTAYMQTSRNKPRQISRPQMPARADGMCIVPRVNPQRNEGKTVMGNRHQWRMTGTNKDADVSRSFEIDRGLVPSPLRSAVYLADNRAPDYRNVTERRTLQEVKSRDAEQESHSMQNNGLTRKCSRCQNGFANAQQHNIGGYNPIVETLQEIEVEAEVEKGGTEAISVTPEMLTPVNKILSIQVPNKSLPGSFGEDFDERDHSACCTDCCTLENCHEGCLGHPSPSSSPRSNTRSRPRIIYAASNSSSTSTSALNPCKSNSVFTQGAGQSATPMRKTLKIQTQSTTIKERVETPSVLPGASVDPTAHLQNSASSGGAGAAARRAMGLKSLVSSSKSISSPGKLINPGQTINVGAEQKHTKNAGKERQNQWCNTSERARTEPAIQVDGLEVNGWDDNNKGTCWGIRSRKTNWKGENAQSGGRNISDSSMRSIEVPGLGSVSSILQMTTVPLEALGMWIKNHPEAQQFVWQIFERMVEMGRVILRTSGMVWEVAYVYSKSGRWKARGEGVARLMLDCGRSGIYLLLFAVIAVMVGRVMGAFFDAIRAFLWGFRVVGWVLRRLGSGLLW